MSKKADKWIMGIILLIPIVCLGYLYQNGIISINKGAGTASSKESSSQTESPLPTELQERRHNLSAEDATPDERDRARLEDLRRKLYVLEQIRTEEIRGIRSGFYAWGPIASELQIKYERLKREYELLRSSIDGGSRSNTNFIPNLNSFASVPLTNKTQPLPHDGLFIRRNNEFGTKLHVGIKDLIDQGVSIDQTLIRFDDFVALNSDRVPLPQSGQSLAVSYGIAPIPLSQKRDDRATHYLEIALRASDVAPAGHRKTQAPPVNYIFVIDTSSSMSGEKLDTVKSTIRELFKRMRKDDVLGIVEFNNQPRTLLKATRVGKFSRNEFSRIISNLTAGGGTDINIGLSFGIDEIGRYESDASLNQIFLFSDGQPSSGETDWIKIRQNVDKKTRGDIRLSTFAFGTDANTRELDALAGLTGGKSNFIADPTDTEEIHLSLQEELNRREHLAGMNVQLKVEIDRDIPIYHLYGHDQITDPRRRAAVVQDIENVKNEAEAELGVTPAADLVTDEKGIRIFVPDLAVGETYWVVFELAIPEGKRQSPVGKTTVQYVDTFARKNRKSEFPLSASGKLPADLVVEHALGLWTSEVAFYALEDLYQNDVDTAKKRIEKHVDLLTAANDKLSSEQIADDKITLKKFVSLAENLGKVKAASDVSPQRYNTFVTHQLSQFGKVRNGYFRTNYSPNP
ncbi:MAG: VWA domain-containing protein [Hormoscilla sp.]